MIFAKNRLYNPTGFAHTFSIGIGFFDFFQEIPRASQKIGHFLPQNATPWETFLEKWHFFSGNSLESLQNGVLFAPKYRALWDFSVKIDVFWTKSTKHPVSRVKFASFFSQSTARCGHLFQKQDFLSIYSAQKTLFFSKNHREIHPFLQIRKIKENIPKIGNL